MLDGSNSECRDLVPPAATESTLTEEILDINEEAILDTLKAYDAVIAALAGTSDAAGSLSTLGEEPTLVSDNRSDTSRTTPAEGSVQSTSAEGSVQSTSAEGSVQSTSAEGSVQSTSAEGSVQSTPAEGSVQSTPSEGSVQSPPATQETDETTPSGLDPSELEFFELGSILNDDEPEREDNPTIEDDDDAAARLCREFFLFDDLCEALAP